MKSLFYKIIAFILAIIPVSAFAQEPEMADTFRSEGKIFVVVAIVLIILIGLFTYLFLIDKKVSKLEKRLEEQTK